MESDKSVFAPITATQVRSKKDVVLEQLRNAIIDGVLKPGQRLVIDELAGNFGVSPIPVREAIQQLQAEGFVNLQMHASAIVSPITPQLLDEVFAILETCELVSARALVGSMTPDQDAQLRRHLMTLDGLVEDLDGWQSANLELHQFICDVAGMPLVRNTLTRTLDHWNRLRRIYLRDVYNLRLKPAQIAHWDMYRAITKGDQAALERATCGHLRVSREQYARELARVLSIDKPNGHTRARTGLRAA